MNSLGFLRLMHRSLGSFHVGNQMNGIGFAGLAQVHLIAGPEDLVPAAKPGLRVIRRLDALSGRR